LVLGLAPLEPGPLRNRLEATARRLNFRCTEILVWDTRDSMVNAMVTGPLPFLRYVVLTDRLLTEMTPDEVEPVFGHEVGHVKHHLMFLYFLFLIASLVMLVGLWNGMLLLGKGACPDVAAWMRANEGLSLVSLLGVYLFVSFGFLSRRCERQADIFGCRTVN